MPPKMLERIRELHSLAEATAPSTDGASGKMLIQLINPGWGSSGYYSAEVLEAAAKAKIFGAGTQSYIDHPSESERVDRPERSVRDLAAVLTSDAAWDGSALVAEIQTFGPMAGALAEMKDAIGISIRAAATVATGEAEGRTGTIITELVEGVSVDFVTNAGRGGRILDVLESARPTLVCERAVSHGVAEATANDTRNSLDAALDDRFGGQDTYVWVCDFDNDLVWYQVSGPDSSDTYQLGYSITDAAVVTLSDTPPVEVTRRTEYVPVGSAGGTTTTSESLEDNVGNIQVDEAEHRRLTEAVAAATQRAEAAEARADEAERRNALTTARDSARPIAVEIVSASETLTASAQARVVRESVAALVVSDAGTFDEAAFRTAVEAARTAAETEIAEALQAAGVGAVHNGGGGGDGHVVTREESDAARAKAFGRTVTESKGA